MAELIQTHIEEIEKQNRSRDDYAKRVNSYVKEVRDQTSSAEAIFKKKLYKNTLDHIHDKAANVRVSKNKYDGLDKKDKDYNHVMDTLNILKKNKAAEVEKQMINEISDEYTTDEGANGDENAPVKKDPKANIKIRKRNIKQLGTDNKGYKSGSFFDKVGPLQHDRNLESDIGVIFKKVGRLHLEKIRDEKLRETPHCNKYYADPLKFKKQDYALGTKFSTSRKDLDSYRPKPKSNLAEISR